MKTPAFPAKSLLSSGYRIASHTMAMHLHAVAGFFAAAIKHDERAGNNAAPRTDTARKPRPPFYLNFR
jgi:hypothetical protein